MPLTITSLIAVVCNVLQVTATTKNWYFSKIFVPCQIVSCTVFGLQARIQDIDFWLYLLLNL